METVATVLRTDGDMAYVRIHKNTACSSCEGCANAKGCHTELTLFESAKSYETCVQNTVGAKTGDKVELFTESRISLMVAFLVFLMPIIGTVVAYNLFAFENGAIKAVLSAAVFFVLFFTFAFVSNRICKKYTKVVIRKIITRE